MSAWVVREWDATTRTGVVQGVYTLPFEAPHAPADYVVGEPVTVSLVSADPGRPHVQAVVPTEARLPNGAYRVEGAEPVVGVPAFFRCGAPTMEGEWSIWVGLDPYPDAYHPWGDVLCPQGELWVEGWQPEMGEAVGPFSDVRDTGEQLVFRVPGGPRRWLGGALGRRRRVRFVPRPPSERWDAIERAMASAFDMTEADVWVDGETVRARLGSETTEWRGEPADEALIASIVRAWRQHLRE